MNRIIICRQKTIIAIFVFILTVSIALFGFSLYRNLMYASHNVYQTYKTYFEPGNPPEASLEEIYRDVFMSLLEPYIHEAVYNYYGQPFTVDPWSPKILSIERPNGYRTFYFILMLEVIPYYGPHIGVGVDQLTITVGGTGDVKVQDYKHIKTYEIPPRPGKEDAAKSLGN